MSAAVSIFGLGYVGAVTAACLAHQGHTVWGVDPNPIKVEALQNGRTPIVEAEVERLVAEAHAAGRIFSTADPGQAVRQTDISFISVGTPSLRNGRLDLSHVQDVCRQIGAELRAKAGYHCIVLRSTVLPGTTEQVVTPILEQASGKRAGLDFGVCFNPEFLREGSAVHDFFHPPFTVIGTRHNESLERLKEIYSWVPGTVFETDPASAEMVKYVCNSYHALKVTFANEIGTLCGELGLDSQTVMDIFKSDTNLNISSAYLKPGFAFGGSCLPKDLRALNYRGDELDLDLPLLQSILPSNAEHINRAVSRVLATGKRNVGIFGLSFKAGTDDLRESPMVLLVKRLFGEGCRIRIWDRDVALGRLIGSNRAFIQEVIPHIGELLSDDMNEVLNSAQVVVLGTNGPVRQQLLGLLRDDQVLIDLNRPFGCHRESVCQEGRAARVG
jgi:GDP-mannose 6-dehydrogenase